MNLETGKHTKWIKICHSQITNHDRSLHFELVGVNFCFIRGLLRGLTAAKKANVSWLLNSGIHVLMKRAVRESVVGHKDRQYFIRINRFVFGSTSNLNKLKEKVKCR